MLIKFIGNDLFPEFEKGTIEELVQGLSKEKAFGFDIETGRTYNRARYDERVYVPGLDPYMSRIVMMQFYLPNIDTAFVLDTRVITAEIIINNLKEFFESKDIEVIGHNLQFECKFMMVKYGIKLRKVWDTMIVEKILTNGLRLGYSLLEVAKRYLGKFSVKEVDLFNNTFDKSVTTQYKKLTGLAISSSKSMVYSSYDEAYQLAMQDYIDKGQRLGFVNIGDRPFTNAEIRYGAADVKDPYEIAQLQRKGRMTDSGRYNPKKGIELELKVLPLLAEMSVRGMKVCPIKWNEKYQRDLNIFIRYKKVLDDYVVKHHPKFAGTPDMFGGGGCAIKWSSSKQVIELFKSVGRCPEEFSKRKGRKEYTVGATALFKILTKKQKQDFFDVIFPEKVETFQDFILAFMIYKKYEQLTTTFGPKWLRFIHPITGRIHANYNQYMYTSRLSGNRPNMMNLPSDALTRACFDDKMVCADYSSQESRILAEVTQVPSLVKFFNEGHPIFGRDMHSYAATEMFRLVTGDPELVITKQTDPERRSIAKAFNFALSYGASPYSIMHKISKTEEEAAEFMEAYFDSFPGLFEDFEATKAHALEHGWIQLDPITDKRYFFPDFERMKMLAEEGAKLKPDNWRTLTKEQKEIVKQHLRETTEWSNIWREWATLKGQLERKSLNYRIQGMAASMTKQAIIYADECGLQLLNIVHDELLAKWEQEEDDYYLQYAMEKAGNEYCPSIPIEAQAKKSEHWVH